MSQPAAITGVGQTGYATEATETYAELAETAARRALDDADIAMADVDAVVVPHAPGGFIGVGHPERWVADFVGAVGNPSMRIHTGGATGGSGAQAGYYHVASGRYDNVLVVGADKIKESQEPQAILNTTLHPIWGRPFGLNAINVVGALQASRYMDQYGATREDFARVVVRSRSVADRNPHAHLTGAVDMDEVVNSEILCWPLGRADACPSSAGGCAVVVSSEDSVRERDLNPAWMTGIGTGVDSYFVGDRMGESVHAGVDEKTDYANWATLRDAANAAYDMAGIEDPLSALDVAELYAPFSCSELTIVEEIGLCERGEAPAANREGRFHPDDGTVPVNPSGGVLCANPISVTGLVRVAEAALQVRGTAGRRQVSDVERAVATSVGGCDQFHTAIVLDERTPA